MCIAASITGLCLTAACWSRWIQSRFPAGRTRVLLTAPVVGLFQYLPVHFKAEDVLVVVLLSACLSWWATFKVIAMGLGRGPLRSSMTMPQYAVALLLPVTVQTGRRRCGSSLPSDGLQSSALLRSFLAKGGLLSAIVYVLTSFSISDKTRHLLYAGGLYSLIGVIMDGPGICICGYSGMELTPHFDNPYFATSLSDFWGRRWNLMAGSTLRMLVYEPLTEGKLVDRKEGQAITTRNRAPVSVTLFAVVATFTMSGVMHELVIWHATGIATMEWLGFFTLHGFAVAGEQVLTKAWRKCMVGRNPFPPAVSWVCTMVFLLASAEWLFFPPCTRSGLDKEVINSIRAALL